MQRLFSMFPNGWPGRGLLLLRIVAGILLMHDGALDILQSHQWQGILLPSIVILAGTLILVGFWTPMAGALVFTVELWLALSGTHNLRSSVVLATLGAALAMLGPGVRSVDARLFGRKRIDIR